MPHFIARSGVVRIILLTFALSACQSKPPPPTKIDFGAELPPGQLALRKLSPGEYPDFSPMLTDLPSLSRAIDNSLRYLATPSSRSFYPYLDITHDRAVATLGAMQAIAAHSTIQPIPWNQEIREKFEVYQSIGAPTPDRNGFTGTVLFTGYFTPIYNASLTREGPFQYPLYKSPQQAAGTGAPVTTLTRQQIETNPSPMAGQELCYLSSRWEAYVITVQGSARLRMPDGTIKEIGFAGTNGLEYISPGKQMLADGVITREQLTLRGLRDYFAAHPQDMDRYLNLNPRYVFFTDRPGGPFGSLNVPVTAFATIATDKAVYPRAMPAFLDVPIPRSALGEAVPFKGFMLDQDTGGAIRAAGRCDIFMGVGPEAEALAGHELHEGKLYYIAVKPELVPQYLPPAKVDQGKVVVPAGSDDMDGPQTLPTSP